MLPTLEKRAPLLIWPLVGAGALLRLYHLGVESAWTDELWAIQRAKSGILSAMESQASRADPNWVYDTILYFWIGAFGDSEYSTRMLSVIFGTLAIYGIYRVGEQLFDRSTGIAAAAILSVSVLHLDFSQQARMYSLSGCLALASFYGFSKVLNGASKWYYAIWFIPTTLAFYTHFLCALTLVAQIAYLLIRWKRLPKGVLENFAVLHLVMLLFLNLCFSTILNKSSVIRSPHSHFGLWEAPSLGDVLNVLVDYSGSYYLFGLLACLAAIAMRHVTIARGKTGAKEASDTFNSQREGMLLVLLWGLVPSILVFCVASIFPGLHSAWRTRYLFSFSFGYILLCAYGFSLLHRFSLRTGVTLLFILFSTLAYADHDRALNRQQIRQSCEYVHQHIEDGDQVAIYPDYYRKFVAPTYLKWHSGRIDVLSEIEEITETDDKHKYHQELEELLKVNRRIWILYFLDHDESQDRDSSAAIASTRELASDEWHVAFEQGFESRSRTFRKPYTGAYVILLEPCVATLDLGE